MNKRNLHLGFLLTMAMVWLGVNTAQSKEGMWIPTLLEVVEDDMQAMGLKLSAEDIYSINHSSLKDAVVHFNGGCTAEMVSSRGLMLTNQQCGYDQIQQQSSVDNDLLTHGFWAMNLSEELANPGVTATFIDRIEDVTRRLSRVCVGLSGEEREKRMKEEMALIVKEATEGTGLDGRVVTFDFGNMHCLITTRVFKDVRLVGAPPSAVGKFGGDADNWVWPRHTGDFSVFRIYADLQNNPAEYSDDNVPYRPAHHFPVSLDGVQEGDFTMVFGFPGRTEQYLTSDAVEHVITRLNPMRIAMRDEALAVINSARATSDELRIAYASKQSSVANAWKKWKGQNRGLTELHALDVKRNLEARLTLTSGTTVIDDIAAVNATYFPYLEARSLFIEWVYYGPDLLNYAHGFQGLIEGVEGEEREALLTRLRGEEAGFWKNCDPLVDKDLMARLVTGYLKWMPEALVPQGLEEEVSKAGGGVEWAESLYDKSVFDNPETMAKLLANDNPKSWAKLEKDPMYQLVEKLRSHYFTEIAPQYGQLRQEIDGLSAAYTRSLRETFPEEVFPVDANSTLRLTYGKVEGSAPYDGMQYNALSTSRGILQKYIPGDPDFDMPARLVELLETRQHGQYADESGDLVVCFTGSNHTTGGNSGSPALNGMGHLVGINFDRSWESTMSDILFDPSRCRNIMVDIRYVLWVIDVYAGAGHLVDEMTLVNSSSKSGLE
ncbi:MAG: S46 family peptidase [Bacteroidetes bacterium]|nr:S46 family peptidase [Bacteroidota bacterium]MDA0903767.1 S46 family peptidase [Bacteroidota bacterium]MDA1242553.1 S46 family peptidase [Bacteroidota bacterium]